MKFSHYCMVTSCDSENVQIKLMNYKNTKRTISKATC